MSLFHVSEESNIEMFQPRLPPSPNPTVTTPVVWAVDQARLANYLVPRECPRVTFYAKPSTTARDRSAFLGPAAHVVAIEGGWLQRTADTPLWVYELPEHSFTCADRNAGYFVSPVPVAPLSQRQIQNPLAELTRLGAELRVMPSLRALANEVSRSSLAFSCIRMRNAGA